jgi:hypothetical protein
MSLLQNNSATTEAILSSSCLNRNTLETPLKGLLSYVRDKNFEGWDLFDGLNSQVFQALPVYKNRFCRLALIQFCKQSPWNLRGLLMVPKGFNPKGGALFLMGLLSLYRSNPEKQYESDAYLLFQRLKHCRIERSKGVAWGYNHDWQARAFNVPQGTPNLVTSVYVGHALLEYYQTFDDSTALESALDIADFILSEMIKFEADSSLCFNYIPQKDAEVHNANLLGAAYLARVLPHLDSRRQENIRTKIIKSILFSINDINPDGSWPYGTKPFHRWIDNFHTAFNIECLIRIGQHLQTDIFVRDLQRVVNYYLDHLFTENGLPKYYNTRLYPIDIHVIAESILVLNQLRHHQALTLNFDRINQIESALLSLVQQFQNPKGYFYTQKMKLGWNKIPYIRWGQAWMLYALSDRIAP